MALIRATAAARTVSTYSTGDVAYYECLLTARQDRFRVDRGPLGIHLAPFAGMMPPCCNKIIGELGVFAPNDRVALKLELCDPALRFLSARRVDQARSLRKSPDD